MPPSRRPAARTKRPLRPAAARPAGPAAEDPTVGEGDDADATGTGTTATPADPGGPTVRRPATRVTTPPPRQRQGGSRGGRPPQRRRPPKRSPRKWIAAVVALVLVAAVVVAIVLSSGGGSAKKVARGNGPEGIDVPAAAPLGAVNTAAYGQPIDGISCLGSEQLAYHVHAHLSVFVNGKQVQVPEGIGIAPPLQTTPTATGTFVQGGGCFYWLHTHAADGVIHLESPSQKIYTVGQFFDVWGQKLAAGQVGPATGKVSAFLDGKPFTGDPRDIPLNAHAVIQLDVGDVVAPQPISWSGTGL